MWPSVWHKRKNRKDKQTNRVYSVPYFASPNTGHNESAQNEEYQPKGNSSDEKEIWVSLLARRMSCSCVFRKQMIHILCVANINQVQEKREKLAIITQKVKQDPEWILIYNLYCV